MTSALDSSSQPQPDRFQADTPEARWARWQAAGAAQDRTWSRRAAVAAMVAFGALAGWLAFSLYLA